MKTKFHAPKPEIPKQELRRTKDIGDPIGLYDKIPIYQIIKIIKDAGYDPEKDPIIIQPENTYEPCYFTLELLIPETDEEFQNRMNIYNSKLEEWNKNQREFEKNQKMFLSKLRY